MKHKFVNAQQMHQDHPDTFEVPSDKELAGVKEGSIVKVCHNDERFWTVVKAVDGEKVTAEVNNCLIGDQPFDLGDEIEFKKENIYCIWE